MRAMAKRKWADTAEIRNIKNVKITSQAMLLARLQLPHQHQNQKLRVWSKKQAMKVSLQAKLKKFNFQYAPSIHRTLCQEIACTLTSTDASKRPQMPDNTWTVPTMPATTFWKQILKPTNWSVKSDISTWLTTAGTQSPIFKKALWIRSKSQ